jgi:tetratricopeptide (TPR) repeat protein/transcriptional regulator with XRE-family HTH domain
MYRLCIVLEGTPVPEETSFGEMLRRERKRMGWTQTELAEKFGERVSADQITKLTIFRWENGINYPSPSHRKQLVGILGLSEENAAAFYRAMVQAPPDTTTAAVQVSPEPATALQAAPKIPPLPTRNLLFTGREAYFARLDQCFKMDDCVALTGLAGIGKTQLALEYAHRRYKDRTYRAVFWVNAAGQDTIESGYRAMAEKLALPERDEPETRRVIDAVKQWLENHTNWLLVMDNADNLELARSFFPAGDSGHILLTTRSQFAAKIGAQQIGIDRMESGEGLAFLLRRSDKSVNDPDPDTVPTVLELVELLGGHPLALDQAGAYVHETGALFAEYIRLYHEQCRSLLDMRWPVNDEHEGVYDDHPEAVAATFELCFRKASERHVLAGDILHFCAFLHPDAIPEELLLHGASFKPDTVAFRRAIAALRRYSLIKRNMQEKTLSIHRLVQDLLVDKMSQDIKKQWQERVIHAVIAAFPDEVEFRNWRQCERLLPHVLVCAKWTEDELTPSIGVASLFRKTGIYLAERGQFSEAESLLERVLSMYEKHFGAAHPKTALLLNDLALTYFNLKKYNQAEPLFQQAIAILEEHLGAEHYLTAECLRNLALLYLRQDKDDQAQSLLSRALSIEEKHFGADQPKTAYTLSFLAILYHKQSEYGQAELLYRRSLSIWEKHLGAEHPDTALPLRGLAALLDSQGKYDQAEALYHRVLNLDELRLGATNPDILKSRRDFANYLHSLGRHAATAELELNDESPV